MEAQDCPAHVRYSGGGYGLMLCDFFHSMSQLGLYKYASCACGIVRP